MIQISGDSGPNHQLFSGTGISSGALSVAAIAPNAQVLSRGQYRADVIDWSIGFGFSTEIDLFKGLVHCLTVCHSLDCDNRA